MSWGLVADLTGALLLLLGALLCFAAAVGLLRFPDVLSRMHAATKPQTLGLLLLVAGVALEVRQAKVLGLLFLMAVLQLLTAPVSAHMVGRTAYRTRQLDEGSLIADELGDDLARAGFRLIDRDSVAEDRDLSSGDSGSGSGGGWGGSDSGSDSGSGLGSGDSGSGLGSGDSGSGSGSGDSGSDSRTGNPDGLDGGVVGGKA